jgi:hypothetical protein
LSLYELDEDVNEQRCESFKKFDLKALSTGLDLLWYYLADLLKVCPSPMTVMMLLYMA